MHSAIIDRADLIDELEILTGFLSRHGFETCPVRAGSVNGKLVLRSGVDAKVVPDDGGYWSEVAILQANAAPGTIRSLAALLSADISDSYTLQNSNWGAGSGIITLPKDFRMAN